MAKRLVINERIVEQGKILESDSKKLPKGVLCRARYNICNIGERNANKRVYEKEVWNNVFKDKELVEKLKGRTLWGHAEHPESTQSNIEKVSHIVTDIFYMPNENKIKADFDVLDTPYGRIVNTLLLAECGIGVSTRAEGELEEVSEGEADKYYRVVPNAYKFVTVDFTADPSTYGVVPENVEREMVGIVKNGLESKKMDPVYATQLLETMKSKEARVLLESIKKVNEVGSEKDAKAVKPGNVGDPKTMEKNPIAKNQQDKTDNKISTKVGADDKIGTKNNNDPLKAEDEKDGKKLGSQVDTNKNCPICPDNDKVIRMGDEPNNGLEIDNKSKDDSKNEPKVGKETEIASKSEEPKKKDAKEAKVNEIHPADETDPMTKMSNALNVFLTDPKTRAWLEQNDPMALKQAMEALGQVEAKGPDAIAPKDGTSQSDVKPVKQKGYGVDSGGGDNTVGESVDSFDNMVKFFQNKFANLDSAKKKSLTEAISKVFTPSDVQKEIKATKIAESIVKAERDTLLALNKGLEESYMMDMKNLTDRMEKQYKIIRSTNKVVDEGKYLIVGANKKVAVLEQKVKDLEASSKQLVEAQKKEFETKLAEAQKSHEIQLTSIKEAQGKELLKKYYETKTKVTGLASHLAEDATTLLEHCKTEADVDKVVMNLSKSLHEGVLHSTKISTVSVKENVSPVQSKLNTTIGKIMDGINKQ